MTESNENIAAEQTVCSDQLEKTTSKTTVSGNSESEVLVQFENVSALIYQDSCDINGGDDTDTEKTASKPDRENVKKFSSTFIVRFDEEEFCDALNPEKKAATDNQAIDNQKSQKTCSQDPPGISQAALTNEEVTDHTASLWKYLPIPSDEPEPFPEYLNNTAEFPGSKVIAARVRGKKHKHEGTNCDDWYEISNYGNITIVAVSDGAGSKKFSRIGARESCKSSVGYLLSSFETLFAERSEIQSDLSLALTEKKCMDACGIIAGIVQQSVIKAHEAVEAAFYSRKTNPEYEKTLGRSLQFKDFSGTLLISVIIPVDREEKEHLIITCQIGDGMIALINSEGEFNNSVKLMGVPDSGDFSGETDFLTSSQMKNIEALQLRTKISRSSADTLFVMSDGVADDYFPNETQMLRLYFDLIVNGVLDKHTLTGSISNLSQEQLKLFKRIPNPLIYPWVNDQSITVPIQYTNRICESTGLTLEDLWNNPIILELAQLELEQSSKNCSADEKLKKWLDNYVERGSFDDRTLVVVRI